MHVRRFTLDDHATAKRLRLEALADAPDAFAATLEEELAFPEARWEARTRSNAEGAETMGFFAVDELGECGMAIGVRLPQAPQTVALNGLWMAPRARHRGGARMLVEAVEGWTRALGAHEVVLEVTVASHAARALYARAGYEITREAAPTCGQRQAPSVAMRKRL